MNNVKVLKRFCQLCFDMKRPCSGQQISCNRQKLLTFRFLSINDAWKECGYINEEINERSLILININGIITIVPSILKNIKKIQLIPIAYCPESIIVIILHNHYKIGLLEMPISIDVFLSSNGSLINKYKIYGKKYF